MGAIHAAACEPEDAGLSEQIDHDRRHPLAMLQQGWSTPLGVDCYILALCHWSGQFQLDAIGVAKAENGDAKGWEVSNFSVLDALFIEARQGFF
jgi:hypothetical protein